MSTHNIQVYIQVYVGVISTPLKGGYIIDPPVYGVYIEGGVYQN